MRAYVGAWMAECECVRMLTCAYVYGGQRSVSSSLILHLVLRQGLSLTWELMDWRGCLACELQESPCLCPPQLYGSGPVSTCQAFCDSWGSVLRSPWLSLLPTSNVLFFFPCEAATNPQFNREVYCKGYTIDSEVRILGLAPLLPLNLALWICAASFTLPGGLTLPRNDCVPIPTQYLV